MPGPADFRVLNFYEALAEMETEVGLPAGLSNRVKEWLPQFARNPYKGAFPKPGGEEREDLWIIAVPRTFTGGLAVVLSFQIDDEAYVVHCELMEFRDDPPGPEHLH